MYNVHCQWQVQLEVACVVPDSEPGRAGAVRLGVVTSDSDS